VYDFVTTNGTTGTSSGLSNVTVSVYSGNNTTGTPVRIGVTSSDGAYSFTNIASGSYNVVYEKSGFLRYAHKLTLSNGQTDTYTQILPETMLYGSVKSGGSILTGATVQATVSGTVYTATVGSGGGQYNFRNLPVGSITNLTVSNLGYQSVTYTTYSISAGTPTIVDFSLSRAVGTISGAVTYAGGNVTGVTVAVYESDGTTAVAGAAATTNASGLYTIASVPVGTGYVVKFTKSGYIAAQTTGQTVTEGVTTSVDKVIVEVPGTIKGTVTIFGTPNPISGVRVDIFNNLDYHGFTYTDEFGFFSVNDVPPGSTIYLVTDRGGFEPVTLDSISVSSGVETDVGTIQLMET
jgi:hypothetical protein